MTQWNKIIFSFITFLYIPIYHASSLEYIGKSPSSGMERVLRRLKSTTKAEIPPAPPGPPLESTSVTEEGCDTPFKGVKLNGTGFIASAKRWRNPLGSKFYYYNMAEAMTNRSLGPNELNSLCLYYLFLPSSTPGKLGGKYATIVGAFNNAATTSLTCTDSEFAEEKCEVFNDLNHKRAENVGTIIATDSNVYFLMARCVQNKYRDWALFTSEKHFSLSATLMESLAAKLVENGFSINNSLQAKYDSCSH